MKSKNKKLLDQFITFATKHPELRFWQCLLAWSKHDYILVAKKHNFKTGEFENIRDTYYFEDKRK